jgi:hypothetical protein
MRLWTGPRPLGSLALSLLLLTTLFATTASASAGLHTASAAAEVTTGGEEPLRRRARPANDSIRHAVAIRSVPVRIAERTRGARGARTDGQCVLGASVWYRLRPARTARLVVTTVGSRHDSLVAVFRGPRSRRTLVACSDDAAADDGAVRVRFVVGRRYWIASSACCARGARGGRAVLNVYPPRRAAVRTTIDRVETGAVSGRLFVRGTTRCATPSYGLVEVFVSQRVGDAVASGAAFTEVRLCTRRGARWSTTVDTTTGWAFQPGSASITTSTAATDGFAVPVRERTTNERVRRSPHRIVA